MTTKLTITLEQGVIEKAKAYARNNGLSLSDLIENYLKVVISEKPETEIDIAPVTKSLKGSFKNPTEVKDYKELLASKIAEKHLY